MNAHKVAILGGGRIGEALLSGLLSSGWRDAGEIVITDRGQERLAGLGDLYGGEGTAGNVAAGGGPGVGGAGGEARGIPRRLPPARRPLPTEQRPCCDPAPTPPAPP